jgi:hypothetical protein
MQVLCEDGASRTFHGPTVTYGRVRGYVYTHGVRVYGVAYGTYGTTVATFYGRGKHAWLVQPAPSAAELATA